MLPSSLDTSRWADLAQSVDRHGYAVLDRLLEPAQCEHLANRYDDDARYRATIVMARHGFGRGQYRYFAYPLPPLVDDLRHALYPALAPIADEWNRRLGVTVRYPPELDAFLERCRLAGQTRPTPLILEYGAGDYNCLHQDLYGEHVFPLQVAILLSQPGRDFDGGEFVIVENAAGRRRAQVVGLQQGDAVVFAVNQRPVAGARGRVRKAAMRHGVSVVRGGRRHTLGVIFHDAR